MYNPNNSKLHEGFPIKLHGFAMIPEIPRIAWQVIDRNRKSTAATPAGEAFVMGQVRRTGDTFIFATAYVEDKIGTNPTNVRKTKVSTIEEAFAGACTEMVEMGIHDSYLSGLDALRFIRR